MRKGCGCAWTSDASPIANLNQTRVSKTSRCCRPTVQLETLVKGAGKLFPYQYEVKAFTEADKRTRMARSPPSANPYLSFLSVCVVAEPNEVQGLLVCVLQE
jgi:hypothetical protein